MASRIGNFHQIVILVILAFLLIPETTLAKAGLGSENFEMETSQTSFTLAAKKKKKKKSPKKKGGKQTPLKDDEQKTSATKKHSNLKALVGLFLQDGAQIIFGGSFTMPFGDFYLDAGGDYTSWKTEVLAVSLIRGSAGGGYALGLGKSMLLRIGARGGMAMVSLEFPQYDELSGEVSGIGSSSSSDFYGEIRGGIELDLGSSLIAAGEIQMPVFGGGDGINVSAMSVYGGLGFKF